MGAYGRLTVQPTDVVVLRPYEVHTEGGGMGPAPHWRVLYIAPSLMARAWRGEVGMVGPIVADPAAGLEPRSLPRGREDGTIAGAGFLGRTLRWLEQLRGSPHPNAAKGGRMPAVKRARLYPQERAIRPVTLSEVATVSGVTLSHLVRSFSQLVGLPPRSYQAQLRLARARRMLAEAKPATWVAYGCGFAERLVAVDSNAA